MTPLPKALTRPLGAMFDAWDRGTNCLISILVSPPAKPVDRSPRVQAFLARMDAVEAWTYRHAPAIMLGIFAASYLTEPAFAQLGLPGSSQCATTNSFPMPPEVQNIGLRGINALGAGSTILFGGFAGFNATKIGAKFMYGREMPLPDIAKTLGGVMCATGGAGIMNWASVNRACITGYI